MHYQQYYNHIKTTNWRLFFRQKIVAKLAIFPYKYAEMQNYISPKNSQVFHFAQSFFLFLHNINDTDQLS